MKRAPLLIASVGVLIATAVGVQLFLTHRGIYATEQDNAKAEALFQVGKNLKQGMDRVLEKNKIALSDVDLNTQNTMANKALFSPTGGGIPTPSVSLASNPETDLWYYPVGAIPGLGTNAPERFAVLRVRLGLCLTIDEMIHTPMHMSDISADLGDFKSNHDISDKTLANWPLMAKPYGCVCNLNEKSKGCYFYQVLAIQ